MNINDRLGKKHTVTFKMGKSLFGDKEIKMQFVENIALVLKQTRTGNK